jgi:NDP-sugar pyrophosphorylase family protein
VQAVILAGGLGVRLWPITKAIPKPMVPVAGAPYLEHQLRLLQRQGITDILLLTGYLGEQVESYFGDGAKLGITIRYSREPAPLGTGGALRQARELLAERFLIIYGDSLLPIDYVSVYRALEQARVAGLVVVYDNRLADTSVSNNIALDETGFVIRYDKGTADPQLRYVEAGVLAFHRSIAGLIPDGIVSLEKEIFPKLIAQRKLLAYQTNQRFYDIGTPERLRLVEDFLLNDHNANPVSN